MAEASDRRVTVTLTFRDHPEEGMDQDAELLAGNVAEALIFKVFSSQKSDWTDRRALAWCDPPRRQGRLTVIFP